MGGDLLPDFSQTGWLWLIGAVVSGLVLGFLLSLPRLPSAARAAIVSAAAVGAIIGLVIAHPAYGLQRFAACMIALAGIGAWFLGCALGYGVRKRLDQRRGKAASAPT